MVLKILRWNYIRERVLGLLSQTTYPREINMPVLTVDDNELRQLIYSKENTAVKYISATCEICRKLAPTYEDFSNDKQYSSILFVKIDAKENPVAKEFLEERATPLLVTYHKGVVIEANSASTPADIKRMLHLLLIKD